MCFSRFFPILISALPGVEACGFFFLKVINLRDLEESPKQGINVKMFFPVSFKKKTKLILHFSGSNSVLLSTQFFDTIF